MRRKGLWRLLALLFAFTLIAAACGDDDDGGDTATDGGDETTETTQEGEGAAECPEGPGVAEGGETTDTTAGKSGQDATTTTAGGGGGGGGGGDGTFQVGTLLPETGSLAFLGPPEFAGVDLAVQDINAAGGVNGSEIPDAIDGDSGDTETDTASQTSDRLLSQNVDVIVGAASSGVTLTVIDKITGEGVIQFSPANTSDELTTYDDDCLYFRTAPADTLQGRLLGELIAADGNATLGILALDDAYGTGLADNIEASFTEAGGEVVEKIIYDPNAQNFDPETQQIADADPDAIAVIGFEESALILTSMIEKGIGPGDKAVYGSDGNMGNALGEQFEEQGALEGMKGTTPLTELSDDFKDQLLAIDPDLVDFNYAAESYDAVVITALAANIAGTDDPRAVSEEINGVTRDGEKCTTYEDCLALVEAGTDIDYDGVSGPLEFSNAGEPTEASFGILTFGADNQIDDAATEYQFATI
jgi:branched-chain amino acid transport system substrate-binding protein